MKDFLIVDGYNIIYAWKPLKTLATASLEHARDKLVDMLVGYGKSKGFLLFIIFDAMYTDEAEKSIKVGNDCEVLFTDKEETADSRIERIVYEHRNDKRNIYVATSDGPEQNQILGAGAYRIPARELAEDIERVRKETARYEHDNVLEHKYSRNEVVYRVRDEEVLDKLEKIRRSK